MILEREKFHAFERAGWESIPDGYDRAFGGLTVQVIDSLLDAVGVKKGVKLLDIASGPGYVAAAAAKRGAVVLGIDFARAMVAHARGRHPELEFREGDAEELPLDNGQFDAAVMNFGILHLARPERALAEAHRVLRPGGRFAFSVWDKPQETVAFGIVLRAVEAHGQPRVDLPEGPPFFRYSDPEEGLQSLKSVGFESVTVVEVKQTWRLPAGDGLFNAMKDSTVRTAGLLRAQNPTVLEKIRGSIGAELAKYTKGDRVELPMPALVASGIKPSS
jgi:SAM-dependent methyltransferase